jgi:hypothetical protein
MTEKVLFFQCDIGSSNTENFQIPTDRAGILYTQLSILITATVKNQGFRIGMKGNILITYL